ncbi:PP2C family protein-serine/threonine phosphatase [Sphingomonas sp. LY160]|uniref:PP2C family protein-serine/threonine phosphatase n=1 Tax=Sphingomonas sp. LY160 TaxID=3095342 RepID=UPI002ADEF024|nr:protein phosphatase 2C domain-containing protein [Sphingomonas sp. LY160]MEA1071732.1 protein phosphatase 2C domain-containing protein [Sphingomonas sp. LY160]
MKAFATSHVGYHRPSNEDMIALDGWTSRHGPLDTPKPLETGWALLGDGIGGNAHGEVASELAVSLLAVMLPALTKATELRAMIAAIHDRIHSVMASHEELDGMGTTLVGLVRLDRRLIGFNVGDSRLYRFTAEALEQLSIDDSIGHALTQCIGGSDHGLPVAHLCEWVAGPDERLLLCSDGLTDMLDDKQIHAVLAASPHDPAHALVEAALVAGGYDNVSVVVIDP